jgi:CubicO group peptidase (beta-lactamase class C family)
MKAEVAPTVVLPGGEDLRDLVEPELERWRVPGLEVAVVQGDEVLFAGGFGKADVSRGIPVTPTTLFHHGSTGKTLTALLVAVLVDEGLLEWDRPVCDYLPEFRLSDPVLTERVTIRDLLAHRTGIARHEFMWLANPSWDRAELVRRLRYLEPVKDLREAFIYFNPGYAAAGHVVGAVTGSTWEEQLRLRILEPLGMSSAVTSIREALGTGNLSRPYEIKQGEVVEVEYRSINAVAPAGEIMYCALDSARWLQFQANGGELDGLRLASEDPYKQLMSVQVTVEVPPPVPDEPDWGPAFAGLGLGPALGTYRGRRMIYASGGIDGFRTDLLVLPAERIGVLSCANRLATGLPFALNLEIADRLLGVEPRPWLRRLHEVEEKEREEAAKAPKPKVVPGTSPSHPLEDYVGQYEHRGYGLLQVTLGADGLEFRLGELDFTGTHRHFDTWTTRYEAFDEDFPMTFVTNADGDVDEVMVPLDPLVAPIRFTRTRKEEEQ